MRFRGRLLRLTSSPSKLLSPRLAFFAFLGAAFAIMLLAKADSAALERLRVSVVEVTAPVLDFLSRPVEAVAAGQKAFAELVFLHSENASLRADNAKLLQWQETARRLEKENTALRHLLAATRDNAFAFVTARAVGDTSGTFVRTMLINVGAEHEVKKGQGVLSAVGLMGRINEVGPRSSRVLLLTDLNSRLPVQLEGSRQRAILAGDNSPEPVLQYLPYDAAPTPGERVLTSGDGGLLPPGLPVGVISQSDGGEVRVRLNVAFDRLDYVRVLAFEPLAPAAAPAEQAQKLGPAGQP